MADRVARWALAVGGFACACAPAVPASDAAHERSGAPGLIDQTSVGKHRCPTRDGEIRPFVVEWDATDLSDFEARAARDIVFVRYEGCELHVLPQCVDSSLRGKYGTYRAPQWTSGGVESFEIDDETALFAELPLGAVSLSGNLQRGEKLRLVYFVSGVADATRSAIYRAEIADNPRCGAATHFVYAFNLGAFELESAKNRSEAGSVELMSAGAGAARRRGAKVLKRAGALESCRAQTAEGSLACRVPIRLTLRPLDPGTPPEPASRAEAPAQASKPTTETLLAAGKLRNEAQQKLIRGDGTGCLRDLERAREIDPDTDHIQGQLWAQCTMRSGQCDAGKRLLRRYYETELGMSAETVDTMVAAQEKVHCKP